MQYFHFKYAPGFQLYACPKAQEEKYMKNEPLFVSKAFSVFSEVFIHHIFAISKLNGEIDVILALS